MTLLEEFIFGRNILFYYWVIIGYLFWLSLTFATYKISKSFFATQPRKKTLLVLMVAINCKHLPPFLPFNYSTPASPTCLGYNRNRIGPISCRLPLPIMELRVCCCRSADCCGTVWRKANKSIYIYIYKAMSLTILIVLFFGKPVRWSFWNQCGQ